jgi:hypothetical protein
MRSTRSQPRRRAGALTILAALLAVSFDAAAAPHALAPSGRWTALARGNAPLPPMGWNSWNAFLTDLSEEKVLDTARLMVDSGLARLGYVYVNIDDGWWLKRDAASGRMLVNPAVFPSAAAGGGNSFKPFADRIKAMGLKPGIYTDLGYHSCSQMSDDPATASRLPQGTAAERSIGLRGHVAQDIALYMGEWGFDYIKVDACGLSYYAPDSRPVREHGYRALAPLIDPVSINRTDIAAVRGGYEEVGRALARVRPANDFLFSLCVWGDADVRNWGQHVGNISRTSADLLPWWGRMLHSFDSAARRPLYARPGSWNDPDMLFIGKGDFDERHLTEAVTHFSLWAIINAPLIIGQDLRKAPKPLMDIYGNAEVVALNQDRAGHAGVIAYDSHDVQIVAKTLADPSRKGVVIVNRSGVPLTVQLQAEHLKFEPAQPVRLRNLWSGESSTFTGMAEFKLAPHQSLTFLAEGRRALADGFYLSEIPGRIHVADDGVRVPEADPSIYRSIGAWAGTRTAGERPEYTGWGGAQPDMTPYQGSLQIGGKGYRSGIGILAGSRMEVKNDGEFAQFSAEVGVDDGTRDTHGRVVFEVYGDGRLLARSRALRWGDPAQVLRAPLAGAKVVELIARRQDQGRERLVVTWGEAALTGKGR